jgi:hypothetical protein
MICNPGSYSVRDALALVNPAKVAVHNRPAKRGRLKQVFSLEMGTETLSDSILTTRKPLGKSIDNFLVQGKVLCRDRARFKPAGIFKPFLNNLAAIYLVFDDPLQPIPD